MNPHLHAVPTGEVPENGPQSLYEALEHIRLLEGELERVTDELEGETRARRAAKGEATRYRRLLEGKRREEERKPAIQRILETWRDACTTEPHKVKLVEGGKRWERIVARWDEGWTVEELLLVPLGALESEFHCGKNDAGKTYLAVETIFRDAEQVEKFVNLARTAEDRAFEERLAAHMQKHPNAVFEAVVAERQAQQLYEDCPPAFEPTPSEQRQSTEGEAA